MRSPRETTHPTWELREPPTKEEWRAEKERRERVKKEIEKEAFSKYSWEM